VTEFLSTRQAADFMNTTRQTMHNIRKEGKIPYQVVNKKLFIYRKEDVERLFEERKEQLRKRQAAQGVEVGG
jgi:predicted site-specific integrase-resolvase